jgi:hypothetical protein
VGAATKLKIPSVVASKNPMKIRRLLRTPCPLPARRQINGRRRKFAGFKNPGTFISWRLNGLMAKIIADLHR